MNEPGNPCILLVDDEKNLLVSLRDFLTHEKFDVVIARSGEEALRKLEKIQPDLIILDISMPGMGGVGFLRHITDEAGQPRFPVLVLTARAAMEDYFSTITVDGFLAKPCDESELVRRIREILNRRRSVLERQDRARKKILLAENNDLICGEIFKALNIHNFEVIPVHAGPEVLEKAPAEKPDLILMNEILPRLNGSAVAELLDVMPSVSMIPVVLYEEQMPLGQESPPARRREMKCVKKVLNTHEPRLLLRAINEVLGLPVE